jgi:hypothetical protein
VLDKNEDGLYKIGTKDGVEDKLYCRQVHWILKLKLNFKLKVKRIEQILNNLYFYQIWIRRISSSVLDPGTGARSRNFSEVCSEESSNRDKTRVCPPYMHEELYFKAMLVQEKGKSVQLEMPWQPAL